MTEAEQASEVRPAREYDASAKQRLLSLDAYRGLIMLTLAFEGFGLADTARNHLAQTPDSPVWEFVLHHFRHARWVGCSYWDLIQPSFMFMVGVSMAYSYAKRKRLGQSYPRMLGHAIARSLILIILGIFLVSNGSASTNWSLMNVLTQIGLGYTFLFLLWGRTFRTQAIVAAMILSGIWLAYATYSGAGIDIQGESTVAGVEPQWASKHLANVGTAWHKNANVGQAIDLWLLNLLPRAKPFDFDDGGYQTINFIPSLVTMIFGLMCGELLRSDRTNRRKLLILIAGGFGGLLIGHSIHMLGICPLVKRIWTPSWTVFSAGWCCLILAMLFGIIDLLKIRAWTFPLVVVGMNSIAIYCMAQLLIPWTARALQTHLGEDIFGLKLTIGEHTWPLLSAVPESTMALWEPAIQATLVGFAFWLACFWMYRQKLFVRI